MNSESTIVSGMATLRLIAGCIEVTAALLMLHYASVNTAVKINATLGLIGPTIFLIVSALGLIGLAGSIPPSRILLILIGVFLVFLGAR